MGVRVGYRLGSDQIVAKVLDGEAIVIDLATGIYYGTDGPGAAIWQCAEAGMSRDAIVAAAAARYAAVPEAARATAELLDRMAEAGLLAEGPGGGTAEPDWPETWAAPELQVYDDVAEMVALDPPLPELERSVR